MESIKKGDFSVDAFLKIYCNTPEKLGDINDFSARLLLTKEYLLQPFADVQIYQYVTTPANVLKEYRTRLNDIVSKIIEEKRQRHVTVPPLIVNPLDKEKLEKDFADVGDVFGQVSADRKELQTLRDTYIKEYTQQGMQSNCMQLVGKITQATMTYVNKRIAETVKKVGPAPTQFSVFTMGSMARDESGFFTDLEIGILVAKKDLAVLNYMRRFSQELADRFFKLGEHPDVGGKGLRIDEEDNAPDHLRWYARYASPEQVALLAKTFGDDTSKSPQEGSRVFVATPQEFAQYLEPNAVKNLVGATGREQEIVKGISYLARNVRYLYGDKALVDQYIVAREKYLQGPPQTKNPQYINRRQEIVYNALQGDVRKHGQAGSPIATGKLGDTVDPKRRLYRFPEQVLTNLGFWYNVGVQNTVQIADKLVAGKHMSPEWGNALKDLMNFTMCLRLRKQMKLGKQGFAVAVTQKGYNDLKKEFGTDLTTATRNLVAAKAKKDAHAVAKAEDDVLHAQVNIEDLDKLLPGKADSIFTPEIINALNTKYLPMEKKLLETVQKFIAGDKDAFLGTDVGVAVQASAVIPGKKPVVKTPVKKK